MKAPTPPPPPRPLSARQTRNRRRELIILASVLVFFVVIAIFTPQRTFSGDRRASTLSVEPSGARITFELAERLGWDVSRTVTDSLAPNERTVAVVLDPPLAFRAGEVHALLEGVRRGGALLYAMSDETLNDSLHVQINAPGYQVRPDSLDAGGECRVPNEFSDQVITTFQGRRLFLLSVGDSGSGRSAVDTLLRVRSQGAERDGASTIAPAAIGFRLGRGRVVVVADVDVFRNGNVRVCAWDAAVHVVRILEYLKGGADEPRRATLLFDEYHQGHGVRPGTTRAIALYLRNTSSGKALAHLGIAGIVLLLALGPRALTPRDTERIERRSPLEHVDALARAYWHVNATRTAARRLLRGVRRRTEHRFGGSRRDVTDEVLLDWIAERMPQRRDDAALVRRALDASMPRKDFTRVGEALERLEHDLLTFRA